LLTLLAPINTWAGRTVKLEEERKGLDAAKERLNEKEVQLEERQAALLKRECAEVERGIAAANAEKDFEAREKVLVSKEAATEVTCPLSITVTLLLLQYPTGLSLALLCYINGSILPPFLFLGCQRWHRGCN